MHYYSEKEIRDIIASVVAQSLGAKAEAPCSKPCETSKQTVPVEVSARHVHLTQEAVEKLYGKGHKLTKKRDLSQPGEFLCEERVKIVTNKGEFANVAVLGPARPAVQVELSMTDCKTLGIKAPVNLSGDLSGAADVVLFSASGMVEAKQSAIVAKAHIHMTPKDAQVYGVHDGQHVRVRLDTPRPVTVDDVVIRVKDSFALAMHIDFDEANAAAVSGNATGTLEV
ncbi:MAG: phosphate propanoyltransferase [Clostridia bacterium]|nr:phosphate propanoyltransferase [Clostridia bacterium]